METFYRGIVIDEKGSKEPVNYVGVHPLIWNDHPEKPDMGFSECPELLELIKAQEELIGFYGKNISDNAVFLQMHHVGASLEDCNKGKELRNRIEVLRKGLEV